MESDGSRSGSHVQIVNRNFWKQKCLIRVNVDVAEQKYARSYSEINYSASYATNNNEMEMMKFQGCPKILAEHGDLKKLESAAYGTLSCFDVILFEVIEFLCLTSYLKKRHPRPGYETILKRKKERQYHRHSTLKKTSIFIIAL